METLVDPADAAINSRLTKEEKIRFLREMFRIRRFEQTSLKYYNLGKMGGFLHLYSGQEAVAVGTISLLGPKRPRDHRLSRPWARLGGWHGYESLHGRTLRQGHRLLKREGGLDAFFCPREKLLGRPRNRGWANTAGPGTRLRA